MGKFLSLSDVAFLKNGGFTPSSISGLWRWYKADSYLGIANDGDTVGGGTNTRGPWVDFSGNGDDATNPTSGPVYKTNMIGAMPILQMGELNFSPGGLNDFTVIAVHQKTAVNSFILADSFVANHQLRRDFAGDNTTFFYSGGAGVSPSIALTSPNNFMALTVRRSGVSVTFRENKTNKGGGNEAGLWTTFEIGSITYGGNLNLAELIIYKGTVVSDADLDKLYDEYLKPRWITLP